MINKLTCGIACESSTIHKVSCLCVLAVISSYKTDKIVIKALWKLSVDNSGMNTTEYTVYLDGLRHYPAKYNMYYKNAMIMIWNHYDR